MDLQVYETSEAMVAQHKNEIDIQVATAKKYPRVIKVAMEQSKSMVAISPEIAGGCFYTMTKGGKVITGPSIRLAEIIMSSWGNCNVGGRVIDESAEWITVQGVAHDLETNVRFTSEIRRRIVDKNGKRYKPDLIQTTMAAATAIVVRNAVFKIVPTVIINELDTFARKTALGQIDKFKVLVNQWVDFYNVNHNIGYELLCLKVNAKSVDEITREQLQVLIGIGTSLRDKMTTIEDEFNNLIPEPQASGQSPGEPASEEPPAQEGEKSKEQIEQELLKDLE